MIKKMRYYARFIVVCLLLNNNDDIRHLISELEAFVDEYVKTFKPADANEWHMVIEEITTFMDAEKKLIPINAEKKPVHVAHRLPAYSKYKQATPKLRLQEAILVGNYQNQIKFSELTLDMYRMLQSLGKLCESVVSLFASFHNACVSYIALFHNREGTHVYSSWFYRGSGTWICCSYYT